MRDEETYTSPLLSRYASPEMAHLFSQKNRHELWRVLWVELAKAQKALGLHISNEQIQQLESQISNIDFARVKELEKQLRHDVMAHIHAFGEVCPGAKGIIHMGATSCFVTDNTDLILIRKGLDIIKSKLILLIRKWSELAEKYANLPTLGYTHFQSAQPTTVGKRVCLWLQDFFWDLKDLNEFERSIPFLGCKGATGTQSALLSLFKGEEKKVIQLDTMLARAFEFDHVLTISGQTYPRKIDVKLFQTLSGIAVSSHKSATDLRLLSHLQEVEEPIGKKQIGSSAMPHKRNPVRLERICSLSRFALSLGESPVYTASTQWLERTLDDSAIRRITIPEMFLSIDSVLNLYIHVVSELTVYQTMITKHLEREIPHISMEVILSYLVSKGHDRQHVHERLRAISHESQIETKSGNAANIYVWLEEEFKLTKEDIEKMMRSDDIIGRAEKQVRHFLKEELDPYLKSFPKTHQNITPIEV